MDALIYTRDDREYEMLSGIFGEELPGAAATRGLLDGHYHLDKEYDVVVVDIGGAEGMELVCRYRELYGNTLVAWITDDGYFAGMAIRLHIFDFIVRPLEGQRFRESLRRIREGDIAAWQREAVKNSVYQGGRIGGADQNTSGDVSGRGKIPPKTVGRKIPPKDRRNMIWARIREYFLSESTL